jgi:hypothetical protein
MVTSWVMGCSGAASGGCAVAGIAGAGSKDVFTMMVSSKGDDSHGPDASGNRALPQAIPMFG